MNKKLVPILSAIFIVVSATILLLKDSTTIASAEKIEMLISNKSAKKCFIQEENLFVVTKDATYKISVSAVDIKSIAKNCEIVTKSPPGK